MRKLADYRTLVQEHIARINREAEASMAVGTQPADVEEDCEHSLFEYFGALCPPNVDELRAASLHEICAHVGREKRETTLERLTVYLLDVFPLPPESEHKNQPSRGVGMTTLSRRKQRRVDYGRAQILWRRNPRRYYDQLMESTGVISCLAKEIIVRFWEALMTTAGAEDQCPMSPYNVTRSVGSPS